jgi:hypothetical protein
MKDVRMSLPSLIGIVTIVGAAAFAAGRSTSPAPAPVALASPPAARPMAMGEAPDPLPMGHPAVSGGVGEMPPGHPPVGGAMGDMPPGRSPAEPAAEASLVWEAPPRWQKAPNASSMRMATYRVPRAAGDADDAELSITQAGGSVEANAARWVGQFDAPSQAKAKRTTRKVGTFDVTVVEVEGTYSGGMGPDQGEKKGWALLGAIVSTADKPYFFKLTGPARSVQGARAEFDKMIASLKPR